MQTRAPLMAPFASAAVAAPHSLAAKAGQTVLAQVHHHTALGAAVAPGLGPAHLGVGEYLGRSARFVQGVQQ